MSILVRFNDSQQPAQDVEDLLAIIEAEEMPASLRPEDPVGADCPFIDECRVERWQFLPTYREGYRCHWIIWREVSRCPFYQEKKEVL